MHITFTVTETINNYTCEYINVFCTMRRPLSPSHTLFLSLSLSLFLCFFPIFFSFFLSSLCFSLFLTLFAVFLPGRNCPPPTSCCFFLLLFYLALIILIVQWNLEKKLLMKIIYIAYTYNPFDAKIFSIFGLMDLEYFASRSKT